MGSEHHAVFENRDFSGVVLFVLCLPAAGDLQHEVQQAFARLIRALSLGDGSRVKVDPVAFFLVQWGIGGNLDRRHRRAEWSAAPRGKENQMRTGCGQVCCRDQVVARAGEQVESLFAYRLGVFQHIRDLGAAAFLHAAAGLVLQTTWPWLTK